MGLEPHQNIFLKTKATRPVLSFLLFWMEIHFQCNYVLNICCEVALQIFIVILLCKSIKVIGEMYELMIGKLFL